ncbi:MAG: amidohydrolase family protein [Spirochaetaceae bacterium]|nr:amidohydrolase family protein [Spirochaetaceae bacterium]
MDSDYLLVGGRLVLPEAVVEGGSLLVEAGRVARLFEPGAALPAGVRRVDAAGAWVTPGLMEFHFHGAGGIGVDALGADADEAAGNLRRLAAFLRERGVTAFMPTIVSEESAVERLAAGLEVAGFPSWTVPGIYVEGPFVNPAKRGGIPLEFLRSPDPAVFERFRLAARGRLRVMTIAPELPGAEALYEGFAAAGVLAALGHSEAVLGRFAAPRAPFGLTHLFNAMSPFSHKDAGLAMLPFLDGRPFVELVSDGVHVNDETLAICARAFGAGRIILVSDAACAAGLPSGEYDYFGRRIVSGERGVRYADTDVLMGSRRFGPELLRNWLRATGRPVHEAVRALSLTPRRTLGIDDRGAIASGQAAELVVWEGEFEAPRLVLGSG